LWEALYSDSSGIEENHDKVRTPRRRTNAEYRTREHLSEAEVERLIEATSSHRDATMNSPRAEGPAELADLRWAQVDFQTGVLHVRRAKTARLQRIRLLASSCAACSARRAR
jgi:integrase